MANRAIWSMRKRHEWLATPLKKGGPDIGTIAAEITDPKLRRDPNVVKAVASPIKGTSRLRALYFTRSEAPYGNGPLLHHEGAPVAWRQWAAQHGVPEVQTVAGPRFAQYSALIQAALSGLGIGLVPKLLVQEELALGLLLSPCGTPVSVNQGHYLCYRPDRLDLPAFVGARAALGLVRRRADLEAQKASLIVDENAYAQQLDLLRGIAARQALRLPLLRWSSRFRS